ncbi:MAG: hypothetical protein GY821_11465 [Gammaproteobacteria bacterium]|nr:hypothetical protein [Gammaproteobacteria bacterium]
MAGGDQTFAKPSVFGEIMDFGGGGGLGGGGAWGGGGGEAGRTRLRGGRGVGGTD